VVAATAWAIAAQTPDPELPMLTVAELGILRSVEETESGTVIATITPTYSGCPALREIGADLRYRLRGAGFTAVEVRTQLAPPWTSDWISEDGRRKLVAAGIAAPGRAPHRVGPIPLTLGRHRPVACPRCGSLDTTQIAAFSSTACKSLQRCEQCREPFEAVKPL
jgi:ring-1,2-phenylacetyl-CoA epoxidase subunit PaaD